MIPHSKGVSRAELNAALALPVIRVRQADSGNQTLTASDTKIILSVVLADTHAGWDATNKRYIVPAGQGGFWLFEAVLKFAADTANDYVIPKIFVNSLEAAAKVDHLIANSGHDRAVSVSAILSLAPGDIVEPYCFTDGAVSVVTYAALTETFMQGWRMRP